MSTNQHSFINKDLSPETIQEIQAIYADATKKLEALAQKKQVLIKDYIKSLEEKKIQELRASLGLSE